MRNVPHSSSLFREGSGVGFPDELKEAFAEALLGIGGRTGVETLGCIVNLEKELLDRNDGDGLVGVVGEVLSAQPSATTASVGRRGRLYRTAFFFVSPVVSVAGTASPSVCEGVLVWFTGGPVLAFSSERTEGDRGREFEVQGFRARLASLPGMERPLAGRATGSGGLVSGYLRDSS